MKPLIASIIFLITLGCNKQAKETIPQEGLINIKGSDLYYKIIGQGEPLLIVHGGPGLDHSYFLPQMEILKNDFKMIFYDQRASGKSDPEVDSTYITLDGFVNDIEEIRQELHLGKIHLMAHSWGGLLAMKYAIQYPENLKSLILADSNGTSSDLGAEENRILSSRMTAEDSLGMQNLMLSDDFKNRKPKAFEGMMYIAFRNQFYDRSLAGEVTLKFQDNYFDNSMKLQYLSNDLTQYDLHPSLQEVYTPTLMIYGDYDPLSTISGPLVAEALPDVQYKIIKDCGHFPYIEKPDEFRSIILEFTSNL